MGDNVTRHSQRASAGLSKAVRQDYVPPDTRVLGPDGTLRLLGRRSDALDPVVAYHKFNPARRDARTGKRTKPSSAAAPPRRGVNSLPFSAASKAARGGGGLLGGLLRRPSELLERVPLMQLLVTAALAHRVWTFVTRRFFAAGDRQLAKRAPGGGVGEEEDEYDEEYDMDERAEELLEQMQHASMLPTMLRSSLPRPHRASLAKRAAQQYHSRQRGYRTAHQMLHGGPAPAPNGGTGRPASEGSGRRQAQRRPLGKLEKLDLIVRQQVRAAMLAQQRQQDQLLLLQQQQHQPAALEAGPGAGHPLGLPALAAAADPGSNGSAGSSALGRLPQPLSSGPLVPVVAGAAAAGGMFPGAVQRLQPGPPAPPAFRALPPDLRVRMQGGRHPGSVAMAPANRGAAAGPPPLQAIGLQNTAEAAQEGSAGVTAGDSTLGSSGSGAAGVSGTRPAGVEACEAGSAAGSAGGDDGTEARLSVVRVARQALSRKKVGVDEET